MAGSTLMFQSAFGGSGHLVEKSVASMEQLSGPPLRDESYGRSQPFGRVATVRFAAVTVLVTAFLLMLIAIGAMSESTSGLTTAEQPAPVAAPTAVFAAQERDPSLVLAVSAE